ncbi:MAG: hypothetical protein AAGA56_18805, partial [Myxococcota bacterium]
LETIPLAGPPMGPPLGPVAKLIGGLPVELRRSIAVIDLERVETTVNYLSEWWARLADGDESAEVRLERVVRSQFFHVLWDEQALVRCRLELQLIEDLIVGERERIEALRQHLENLEELTRKAARALLQDRTDEAWSRAIADAAE